MLALNSFSSPQTEPRVSLKSTLATGRVESAALSADERMIVVVGKDELQFWDVASGRLVRVEPRPMEPATPSTDGFVQVEGGGDLGVLSLEKKGGEKRNRIVVWDRVAKRIVSELKDFDLRVSRALFSRDGRRVLTVSEPKKSYFTELGLSEIIVWETETGKALSRITLTGVDYFIGATLSPDGRMFLTKQTNDVGTPKTTVWDAGSGRLKFNLTMPPWRTADGRDVDVSRLAFPFAQFTNDGKLLIATTVDASFPNVSDGNLVAFDAETGAVVWQTKDISRDAERYTSIRLSADQRILVAVREVDKSLFKIELTAEVRDSATGNLISKQQVLSKPPGFAREESLVFSQTAARLITAGKSRAEVLDVRTGNRLCSFPRVWSPVDTFFGDSRFTDTFTFRANERIIAAQNSKFVRLWKADTCALIKKIDTPNFEGAVWSRDERLIVTRAKDKKSVLLWEVN